jgi:hypothetical protein
MMSEKWTKGPWVICWATYNGRKVNFTIAASPYGSIRPIAETRWKTEWSEVEGEELIANAHLIAAAPDLYAALQRMVSHFLSDDMTPPDSVMGQAKAALAKARGRLQ